MTHESQNKIRVLVVDDSALVRSMLRAGLARHPRIEVIATAADAFAARDAIVTLKPDVMTLDVEMPRMDGVEFLRRLMPQWPVPTIICSSLTKKGAQISLDALEAGALDIVPKPASDLGRGLPEVIAELSERILVAARINREDLKARVKAVRPAQVSPQAARVRHLAESTDKVIAIGASTGGTEAIKEVITRLPVDTPGVVIVQHMPPGFTQRFAERLNELSQMQVKEASDGDRILTGHVLVAPGGLQTHVVRSGGIYEVRCGPGEKVNGHCPSVDVLFHSVAREVGANAIGVILTGMGGDGANGMRQMRDQGAPTIAQDEASCVVFGMPKVAIEKGGVRYVRPLNQIAPTLIHVLRKTTDAA